MTLRALSAGLTRKVACAFALVLVSAGCGGLIDTDSPSLPGSEDEEHDDDDEVEDLSGVGGTLQAVCPAAQWDCSGRRVSCNYVTDGFSEPRPIISVFGTCRCDFTRPQTPSDCREGELFVCGALSFRDSGSLEALFFEPVSCRCVENAGYYCSHCPATGLYGSQEDAAGCGLDSSEGASNSAVYCGCGE